MPSSPAGPTVSGPRRGHSPSARIWPKTDLELDGRSCADRQHVRHDAVRDQRLRSHLSVLLFPKLGRPSPILLELDLPLSVRLPPSSNLFLQSIENRYEISKKGKNPVTIHTHLARFPILSPIVAPSTKLRVFSPFCLRNPLSPTAPRAPPCVSTSILPPFRPFSSYNFENAARSPARKGPLRTCVSGAT